MLAVCNAPTWFSHRRTTHLHAAALPWGCTPFGAAEGPETYPIISGEVIYSKTRRGIADRCTGASNVPRGTYEVYVLMAIDSGA